eukprot:749924-Rhodomonas_salina.2
MSATDIAFPTRCPLLTQTTTAWYTGSMSPIMLRFSYDMSGTEPAKSIARTRALVAFEAQLPRKRRRARGLEGQTPPLCAQNQFETFTAAVPFVLAVPFSSFEKNECRVCYSACSTDPAYRASCLVPTQCIMLREPRY